MDAPRKNQELHKDGNPVRYFPPAGYDKADELIDKIRDGDEKAVREFREFVKPKTHKIAESYVQRTLGDRKPETPLAEIADATTDRIITAMFGQKNSVAVPINWHEFSAKFHVYIKMDLLKEKTSLKKNHKDYKDGDEPPAHDHTQVMDEGWGRDPAKILEDTQLWKGVEKLPARQKQVIISRFVDGQTRDETADELRVTDERVKQIEVAALRKLRKIGYVERGAGSHIIKISPERLATQDISESRENIHDLFAGHGINLVVGNNVHFKDWVDMDDISKHTYSSKQNELLQTNLEYNPISRNYLVTNAEHVTYSFLSAAKKCNFSDEEKKELSENIQKIIESARLLEELSKAGRRSR